MGCFSLRTPVRTIQHVFIEGVAESRVGSKAVRRMNTCDRNLLLQAGDHRSKQTRIKQEEEIFTDERIQTG